MDIQGLKKTLEEEFAKVNSSQELEALRIKYLGRKGVLAQYTAYIPTLQPSERAEFGKKVNEFKIFCCEILKEQVENKVSLEKSVVEQDLDPGLPSFTFEPGRLHPITQVIDEICSVFKRMGFWIVEGPEVETEYNNFTGLNISLDHPSRDAFDTFYLKSTRKLLLRSHTSPVQIRVMKEQKPPLAVIVPGRVYRPDAVDASHSFMFHQIEGFMVQEGVNFSQLKGVLEVFAKEVFGKEIKMRFRPHYFPFTEPSAEVDISCIICGGKSGDSEKKKCSVCHGKGWLEILGCGMIHPNVFKNVGYDSNKYSGFAFGMGVERIAMLKFGIDDIRLFFSNDLRFLRQF